MKKTFIALAVFLIAAVAFAHAGEVHKYMGTVTMLHDDGSFMMKKKEGETIHVAVAKSTTYVHADGSVATAAELAAGKRVVVTISKDGKTASEIKLP